MLGSWRSGIKYYNIIFCHCDNKIDIQGDFAEFSELLLSSLTKRARSEMKPDQKQNFTPTLQPSFDLSTEFRPHNAPLQGYSTPVQALPAHIPKKSSTAKQSISLESLSMNTVWTCSASVSLRKDRKTYK